MALWDRDIVLGIEFSPGAQVEIIKPKSLRELIKTEAENIAKIYCLYG
jgi:predicted DNA-binding transcriptional regulator YafY